MTDAEITSETLETLKAEFTTQLNDLKSGYDTLLQEREAQINALKEDINRLSAEMVHDATIAPKPEEPKLTPEQEYQAIVDDCAKRTKNIMSMMR